MELHLISPDGQIVVRLRKSVVLLAPLFEAAASPLPQKILRLFCGGFKALSI